MQGWEHNEIGLSANREMRNAECKDHAESLTIIGLQNKFGHAYVQSDFWAKPDTCIKFNYVKLQQLQSLLNSIRITVTQVAPPS